MTTRQIVNHEILSRILKRDELAEADEIRRLIDAYPDQRFGQIVCNYICPDYRQKPSALIEHYFDIPTDPFYEESTATLERLFG